MRPPGEVRDAVRRTLQARPWGASVGEIVAGVRELIGEVSGSSIRSCLRLDTPAIICPSAPWALPAGGQRCPA